MHLHPTQQRLLFRVGGLGHLMGGSTAELVEVVALAEAGKIKPHIETFAMNDALSVYDKLHHGDISGRAVLIP